MSGMRLRLRILRNELPPVTTLWPISDTQQKNTITQLLEQVNNVFPLESESWGLEHYVVTVASFEALHYHEIGAVCRDEDEVVIRPLSYAEVRARTVLGRDQIAPDGRHLYDGLPYGRPLLRGVVRPEVKIPARKRRRLEIEEAPHANDEVDANEGAVVKFGDLDEEDEESEDDGDFEIEEEEEEDSEGSLDDAESEASSEDSSKAGRESEESSDSGTSSSSDDTSDDDSSGSESWDGIQSGPQSPGKEAASKTALGSRMALPESQQAPQSASGTQQHPNSSKASSEKDTSAQISSSKEPAKFVGIPQQGKTKTQDRNARRRDSKKLAFLKREGTLPSDATLANLREWEATNEVVEGEVAQDQLQPESTSANQVDGTSAAVENDPLTETLDNSLEANNHEEEAAEGEKEVEGEAEKGAEERDEEEVEDEDEGPETQSNLAAKQLEIKRQKLLAQIDSGGIEVESKAKRGHKRRAADIEDNRNTGDSTTSSIAPTEPITGEETPEDIDTQDHMAGAAKKKALGATDMIPSSVARRSRLDVAGSKRLLLGSLGVRVPKTQEEKDALQKKLKDRNDQRIAPPPDPEAPALAPKKASKIAPTGDQQHESDDDSESWREKIDLNAIECCEKGITLSTPPFPFHQRWDPQQRRKKAKGRNGIAYSAGQRAHPATGKGRKKRSGDYMAGGELIETYDKYNQNGGGDALDYDDEWEGDEDDEYWEEGALLDGDYDDEDEYSADQQLRGEAAMGEFDDGFPSLPEDVTTLPLLAEKDAKTSDFVVHTELVCSAATGWQPRMLTRTVQLMGKEDDGWDVKMATRDLRPKEYDGEGNRVYDKFEMQGLSDDEGEEGTKTMAWAEMIEPRLLHRG
ncbi:hypothetical protein KC340_g6831 [Hortaea werneckii]|nr:hypothetical protein KC342_g7071 [Hortaea werneckii]KAI7098585.1 hypothetical protein KC339_g8857 [Hortaea werneckii]KAI7239604.1 hypothetical protein KC365_g4036 [Hortaea werneckii]KAI7323014.1 hypothetical protein KC340_g6831 [Hortaea werneckii]KAI7398481.1 hypothetical protein KC328_g4456 [Hortaea werneckii]